MQTVLLACPTRGRVYHGTAQALSQHNPHYVKSTFSVVDARNSARMRCLEASEDVLLMIDDDVTPPQELFTEGLQPILDGSIDILIFPCPLVQADGRVLPNIYKILEGDAASLHPKLGYQLRPDHGQVVHVDAGGFGAVAITSRCLEKVGPFAARLDPIDFTPYMGEDIDYCLRAKNLDLTVKAHMGIFCDHQMEVSGSRIAISFSEAIASAS